MGSAHGGRHDDRHAAQHTVTRKAARRTDGHAGPLSVPRAEAWRAGPHGTPRPARRVAPSPAWRVALVALLLSLSGLAGLLGAGTAVADSAARALPARVVVVGVPGLEWSDLDRTRTPNLWRLVDEGGAASMSTRAVPPPTRSLTCPVAGWLTVSAGQRAGAPGSACELPAPPLPAPDGGASVPGWSALVTYNATQTSYRPVLGRLGQLTVDAGGKVAAVGPGAALGAADKSGKVGKYAASVEALGDLAPYRLVTVEIADLARVWIARGVDAGGAPVGLTGQARQDAVVSADGQVGALLARLPQGSTVLLAGLSDAEASAHLHVAIAHGPSADGAPYAHGYLSASSTRQDGLVTNTDLTATAIGLLGLETPNGVVGHPWRSAGSGGEPTSAIVGNLADEDLASQVLRRVQGPFFAVFVSVQILFYLLAAFAVRRGWGGSRALTATKGVAAVGGAIPIATFLAQLVPWWTFPAPMASVILTILGIACAVAAIAFAGPWRAHVLGPLTAVAAITSLALLADVMTGSSLQVNAVTGYEPVTGGRFYGFSNIAFAVYSAGTILAMAGIAQWLISAGRRPLALAVCALYGGLAVFADGWPAWGADFGGVPAFLVGVAVFLILLAGKRVSPVKLALVGVAGALLIGAIAVVDWLKPAGQRTHLGAFVQQVLDGEAWTVVGRKFGAMVGVTVGNWSLTLLSLVALAFLFLVLDRPSRWGASALDRAYSLAPPLRAGLIGALACALIGFLMNDSGIAIPAMALTVAVPLTLTACVRALQLSQPTTPARPSARAETTAPPVP
ncbi:hypothetical protein [Streptosporangium carneum]|uniref:Uncharacterized protein n=1 Tax=Streptosporangium carneum TaxID=47481 RepID=A0A9W6HWM2_9ACTN|nr:hypothetical protein [Streptosporangium carneum]GLK07146.1 hypothetical protein GCM10017600_05510 [Streptosporangium carneum]